MKDRKDMTIKELAKECSTVEEIHEMVKYLFKDTIQEVFEAEIEKHLSYKKDRPLHMKLNLFIRPHCLYLGTAK